MKKALLLSAASVTVFTGLNGVASAEQTHVVKENAKLSDVAALFATTTNEIKNLNNLNKDEVKKDTQLVLPDTDIVEVKAGDSLNSIAKKHHISVDKLYELNPGLTNLILPGDILAVSDKGAAHLQVLFTGKIAPETEKQAYNEEGQSSKQPTSSNYHNVEQVTTAPQAYYSNENNVEYKAPTRSYTTSYKVPSYTAPTSYSGNYSSTSYSAPAAQSSYSNYSGANYYTSGQCTSYVFERAGGKAGSLWGNANNWANAAAAAGRTVNNTPTAGAIMQSTAGAYGHVAYVEGVNGDGSVRVSEMNYGYGPGVVTSRTLSAGQAASYNFIH